MQWTMMWNGFITILLQQETDFFLIRYDLASYVNLVYQHYQNSWPRISQRYCLGLGLLQLLLMIKGR